MKFKSKYKLLVIAQIDIDLDRPIFTIDLDCETQEDMDEAVSEEVRHRLTLHNIAGDIQEVDVQIIERH